MSSFTTASNEAVEQSIPARFEKIVRMYPDRLAVKMGDRSLTYDELNRYANRIGRAILEKRGSGSEPIALLFEHGIDIIAAILGMLKAGKFFVVLDPAFPLGRMSSIVEDARTKLIVTNNRNRSLARQFSRNIDAALNVDELDCGVADENLGLAMSPATFSSIMYTSGSTGTPKGVIETHGNILESYLYLSQRFHMVAEDRLSLLHTFAYASSRTSTYLSLLNGASLFPFDVHADGAGHLAEWVNSQQLTILYFPVALFRQFADVSVESIPLPSVRLLRLSGAPITRNDFELYKKRFDDRVLLEISMGSTEARGIGNALLNKQFLFPSEGNPVGYPPPGKKVLILDANHRALPTGEVGQIAIQGKNLNPGYWRLPALTESKYLPDPNGADERIYLTGDIGKLLPDGFLIHLGRQDLMIKVRGYRVDIGEIERALFEHPQIREAGVAAWDGDSGDKYLVGYVVARRESALHVNELKEFLRNKLPDYMVPTTFMFLDSLPLTNGKLDRSALPQPDHRRPNLKTPYVAPRNDVERKLAQIWGEVLSLDQVGIYDHFFDLGGHSLAAAEIVTRVKEMFGVELPVGRLLELPTVAQMSEVLSHQQSGRLDPFEVRSTNSSIGFAKAELEQSIHERFEKIVRLHPDHVAVKAGARVVTYAELNEMANRLAHDLLSRRSSVVAPIAILLDKGVEQFAAMLGVLKAGKFFVLVDPAFPRSRIASIFEDSDAKLVICDQEHVTLAEAVAPDGREFFRIDTMARRGASNNPDLPIAPNDCAYLVYTSGSTGRPKAVVQAHRNQLHNLSTQRGSVNFERDRVALLSSGTTNAISNTFHALVNGGTLCPFDARKKGIHRLASWLVEEKISICLISTALFRNLCQVLDGAQNFPDLRFLRLRSESARKSDVELFRRYFPPTCILAHGLSTSETGRLCEYFIRDDTDIPTDELPIGYVARDKEIFLLDDDGNKVGPNEVGEIVVRSRYLSPGYWRRPDLTAEKFKPDPIDSETRLYHSGDLALMLPDGCLIHKGRKDFRVKIRGYGVDVIEVETALRSYGPVREAAVTPWTVENEARLVAYYTTHTEPPPTIGEMRGFLLETLPDYMIPSAFVKLDALPLTPNGKIDRQALPAPESVRPALKESYVEPRTVIERQLAGMWTGVLPVDRVGLHDNFFDLGGYSLLGARLMSLIHTEFYVDLPVSEFFAAPTIEALAKRIEGGDTGRPPTERKGWTYLYELQRGKDRKPVFVFPGGGGGEPEFFVYGFLARHVGTEYPFYGLRARGADGISEAHTSVAQMADAYVEEIRAIQPEGPYYLVGECAGGVNAYEAARRLSAQGQKIAALVLMDVERPTLIKYFRFRANRVVEPVTDIWNDKVCGWLRENYYLARIPYHLKQLRSLKLGQYPSYFRSRTFTGSTPPKNKPRPMESRRERAAIVLYSAASGEVLRHIERVRENYRRVVRRFRPKPYDGHIEILVSEKLYRHDPTLGWKKLALKGLSIHPLPGDHWSYIRDHVAAAGPQLTECLERAERNPGSCSR